MNPRLQERIQLARSLGLRVDAREIARGRGRVFGTWVTLTWPRLMAPVSTGFPEALDFHLVDLLFNDLVTAAMRPRPRKTPPPGSLSPARPRGRKSI